MRFNNVCIMFIINTVMYLRKYIFLKVIRLIAHQYREIYLKNNDKLPSVLPSTEDQLMYFSKFLKKSMKRLEIYKDVILGKMRIKEYLLKEKN